MIRVTKVVAPQPTVEGLVFGGATVERRHWDAADTTPEFRCRRRRAFVPTTAYRVRGHAVARVGTPSSDRAAARSRAMSRNGGAPNSRRYSRLNCDGLS